MAYTDGRVEAGVIGSNRKEISLSFSDSVGKQLHGDVVKGSFFSTTINWINVVLGVGIMGIPKAMDQCGLFMGLIMIFMIGLLTDYTCRLLIRLAKDVPGCDSIEHLAETAFGKAGFYVALISCMIFDFGALTAYVQFINGSVPSVIIEYVSIDGVSEQLFRILITSAIMLLLVLPLCLLKDLSRLAFTSTISVATFMAVFAIAVVRTAMLRDWAEPPANPKFVSAQVYIGFGTFVFALVCCDTVFQLHNSLRDQTRFKTVAHISMGTLVVLYGLFGTFFYLFRPGELKANLVDSFSTKDTAANVARVCLAVTVILTFPMSHFAFRTYVTSLLKETGLVKILPLSTTLHVVVTVITVLLSMGLAYAAKLEHVMSLTGLISVTMVGFIIPCALYFKMRGRDDYTEARAAWSMGGATWPERLAPWLQLILPAFVGFVGFIAFAVGAPLAILHWVQGDE